MGARDQNYKIEPCNSSTSPSTAETAPVDNHKVEDCDSPIRFHVLGKPITQGNHRIAKVGRYSKIYDSAKGLDQWRLLVAWTAQRYAPAQPFDGAVALTLDFFLPVPKSAPKRRRLHAIRKPDALKLARAVEDALTGVIYRDDARIVRLCVSKHLAYDSPIGCHIEVQALEDPA